MSLDCGHIQSVTLKLRLVVSLGERRRGIGVKKHTLELERKDNVEVNDRSSKEENVREARERTLFQKSSITTRWRSVEGIGEGDRGGEPVAK